MCFLFFCFLDFWIFFGYFLLFGFCLSKHHNVCTITSSSYFENRVSFVKNSHFGSAFEVISFIVLDQLISCSPFGDFKEFL